MRCCLNCCRKNRYTNQVHQPGLLGELMKTASLIRTLFLLMLSLSRIGFRAQAEADLSFTAEPVGRPATNRFITPVNQILTPAGTLTELPGIRPQALALSPDGQTLATSGLTHELIVIDPGTGSIRQRVPFPSGQLLPAAPVSPELLNPDAKAQISFTGLAFSPDGSRIYLSNVNGDLKVFSVGLKRSISPLFSIPLPSVPARGRTNDIPAGIAVSRNGKRLYVALNLSNRLAELDAANGRVLRIWEVGVAPFDVALTGHKAYVSNWGGRRPAADSMTGPAGRGTLVRADARSVASEGSVSVIDLDPAARSTQPKTELITGLHASALALSPNRRWLAVANAGSDTVSILDTRTDRVVETLCARQNRGDLFGAQPDALAFDRRGNSLFVCNGTQNAIAVIDFKPGASRLLGLIPVGWFPGAIAFDAKHKQLCVANLKGLPIGKPQKTGDHLEFNSKEYRGTISMVPLPSAAQLKKFTQTALANLRYPLLAQAGLPARSAQPARPVPERVGEPSVFRHVIYIIKENRTYDQVLGDVQEGNGDADLCSFGERVTPNQHKLVRQFALLDNTYCSGILSADGHNWSDSAIATDYIERSFAGWPRSYPCGGGENDKDALAYSPAGFIWNNALSHGKTFRDFGEFCSSFRSWKDGNTNRPSFAKCFQDYSKHTHAITYRCEPDIESLRPYIVTNYPSWDLNVPDQVRAERFIQSLKEDEATGTLPDFTMVWLPNDHTSATKADMPTPAAQVADNDLAFGKIIDALSHSRFWRDTCLFAIEDDPQAGWDHVSGYRTTAYVISPYTRRGAVIPTQYNQTSLLRTMELILGLPPMNQMDATGTPMFDCFTNTPDFTPFESVANNIPLNETNPAVISLTDRRQRRDALISARLPLDKPDQCPEGILNEILWHSRHGFANPYPQWAVTVKDDD